MASRVGAIGPTPGGSSGYYTLEYYKQLVPNAEVVIDPVLVTEAIPAGRDVLACGPEPMLRAVAEIAPRAQLAWEAPMACGYGACYGCAVEIDGELKRLCVEGPVLEAA